MFVAEPTLSSMHFYSLDESLLSPAVQAIKFTVYTSATNESKAPE
jgi:hypothetical protein